MNPGKFLTLDYSSSIHSTTKNNRTQSVFSLDNSNSNDKLYSLFGNSNEIKKQSNNRYSHSNEQVIDYTPTKMENFYYFGQPLKMKKKKGFKNRGYSNPIRQNSDPNDSIFLDHYNYFKEKNNKKC